MSRYYQAPSIAADVRAVFVEKASPVKPYRPIAPIKPAQPIKPATPLPAVKPYKPMSLDEAYKRLHMTRPSEVKKAAGAMEHLRRYSSGQWG